MAVRRCSTSPVLRTAGACAPRVSPARAAPDPAQQPLGRGSAVDGLDDLMMLPEWCAGCGTNAQQRLANGGQFLLGAHNQADLPALFVPRSFAVSAFEIWRADVADGPKQIGEVSFVAPVSELIA